MASPIPPPATVDRDAVPEKATLAQLREGTLKVLPAVTAGYLETGAGDQKTVALNVSDFDRVALSPHVLRDVTSVSTSTSILGCNVASPILVAPVGAQCLYHLSGETGTAKGAGACGVPMVLSAYSNTPIEEVAGHAEGGLWAQINVPPDKGYLWNFLDRAQRCADAVVVTVDTPVVGAREAQEWDGLTLPTGLGYPMQDGLDPRPEIGDGIYRAALDAGFTAEALEEVAGRCELPIIVKGVLRADDAIAAVEAGASAIVVSNHGGRNLDSALSGFRALPAVVDKVDGRVPVLMDGGVRRGTDVLKALALGADGVLVGRPVIWGLTVAGSRGVEHVLRTLTRELAMAMALCGVRNISDIGQDIIHDTK